MKLLVIANSARSIVCSAKRAGHTVYALDRFGDVDMRRCADKSELISGGQERLHELAASFGEVDAVILGPGFEHLEFKNTLNNPKDVMDDVNDKSKLPGKLSSLGIPHPQTESIDRAERLGFPVMIKPKSGSGGLRNVIISSNEELTLFNERTDAHEFIAQEFVEGIPCSASVISTADDAVTVALNEQLIGLPWLTGLPFAYCGNITPFHTEFSSEMTQYAEKIALEFGLVGSNGIDFMVTENGIVAIEVNPRFQGSIDTVERSTGMNIVDAHIKSFDGELPKPRKSARFAAKAIVYAKNNVAISKSVSDALIRCMELGRAADIPQPGSIIQTDQPVVTMLATSGTRSIVSGKLEECARRIKSMFAKTEV